MNGNLELASFWLALTPAQTQAVELLGWSLVHFLWQGATVALLLSMLLWALRRASAAARYATACAALLLMAVCPPITLAWSWANADPQPALRAVSRQAKDVRPSARAALNSPPAPAASNSPSASGAAPAASMAESLPREATRTRLAPVSWLQVLPAVQPLLPWFVAVWLAGVTVLTARLCGGWLRIQRLRRRVARPVAAEWQQTVQRLAARMHVARAVTLLQSALVEVPTVIGWLRPVILLPASALLGLSTRQLEALLAHELAHVRRHDYLVNLFQTALETLLFYHPAVWWASRVVRAERETCCDEIAVAVSGDRLEYARALASLEELRARGPRLAMAASGGPLLDRIRRLVGAPAPQANRSAWWIMAAVAAGLLAMAALPSGSSQVQAGGAPQQPAKGEKAAAEEKPVADDWGPESNGLRCRLAAIPPSADDDAPQMAPTTDAFVRGNEATFAVELQNVGKAPLTLLSVGKSDMAFLGPHLFEFTFIGENGKPAPRPKRAFLESMLQLSGAATHELAPGKSLVILLRPAQFNSPMEYRLPTGTYRATVRYLGPSEKTLAQLRKLWPDKPQAKAWSGKATSNEVGFTVAEDPPAPPAELVWGEAKEGLRAAVEFRQSRGVPDPDDPPGTYPLNTVLDVTFHIKNVGEKPISLVSETWRQDDALSVKNEAGEEQQVGGSWYTGLPIMSRWKLEPGDVADIQAANLGLAADQAALETFEHPVGKSLVAAPGKYTFRYTIRFGNLRTADEKGNPVPGKDDWVGELATGDTTLVVRARTPADDARERIPTFVGRIEFTGPEGRPVESGQFTTIRPNQRGEPARHEIHRGPIDVPDCTDQGVNVSVRAPGFEEAYFQGVQLTAEQTKRIELKPAAATRLRLVSSLDGGPVAGAKVRHFNKSCGKASAGPFPMAGIKGTVLATSQQDGTVVLDSLQRVDPYYADLGDVVYFVYIEPAELAPRFLGPVKAGQDLGDITLGPLLEVRGEIRCTAEEMKNFAAEWDQPFELTTDNPDAAWWYAVSEPLTVERAGEKATFHLTGLRPGKLRIIANFSPSPHQVTHTYGRRDPMGTDVVIEVDLKESIADLVITPAGRQKGGE